MSSSSAILFSSGCFLVGYLMGKREKSRSKFIAMQKAKTRRSHGAMRRFAIIVHGGAYDIPDSIKERSADGCRDACKNGFNVLVGGGTACDAVEAALICLENNPVFDAGTGSVLTINEEVEMDAVIMDGKQLNAGAVACVKTVKNPISLARAVMDKTEHVMLVGKGADDFARKIGMKKTCVDELTTQEAKEELRRFREYNDTVNSLFNKTSGNKKGSAPLGHDTVGCVALDSNGNIAAGTSTGGITAKMSGRVGDSPIIGSGCYANSYAGASSTGHGESIMKVCLTKACVDSAERAIKSVARTNSLGDNQTMTNILNSELNSMENKVNGCGGVILITGNGEIAHAFTTPRMCYAKLSSVDMENAKGEKDSGIEYRAYNGMFGVEKDEERRFKFYQEL